jgi:DNA-binding NtrC family response regulator
MGSNTIMIVDDEKKVLNVIERVLRKEDYDIHCVTSATNALDSIEEIKPQVILSDRRMPHMEGLDLLTRVKERHPSCYCVLMTGYPYIPESVQHALQKGNIDLVIKKPIDNDALITKIREAFKNRQ